MACNSSTCQSNCYGKQDGEEENGRVGGGVDDSTPKTRTTSPTVSTNEISEGNNKCDLCVKCKVNAPISGGRVTEDGRLCGDCFRSNLFGKFRQAVTGNAMISPSDNVLVAFSGGPSSRVALQFVHELQQRSHKNFEASRDRSLPVFGVGVAFIDESAVCSVPSDEVDDAIQDFRLVVQNLVPPRKEFHVVPIEDIYSSDFTDRRNRLNNLLCAISDETGKEDLTHHLRMLSLQKIAIESGYNRILLGSCTSRIACHVISATVKGQGYSLPADIQYVDARWSVPVVLPLRDCLAQELNLLCQLDGLKTVELLKGSCSGINSLVLSFVTLLQEENPSRECTIVRTAGKLTPFQFNRIPEIKDDNVPLATKRLQQRSNIKSNESISSDSFCLICNSPLSESDSRALNSPTNMQTGSGLFSAAFCSSCQFQILPKGPTSMEDFYLLLPQALVSGTRNFSHGNNNGNCNLNMLREEIQEFLLSDSEAESEIGTV